MRGNNYTRFSGFLRKTRVNVRFCRGPGVARLLQHKDQIRDRLHERVLRGGVMSGAIIAMRLLAPVIYGSAALVVLIMGLQFFAIDVVKHVNALGLKFSKASRTGA